MVSAPKSCAQVTERRSSPNWVVVKGSNLSYRDEEAILFTIDPCYGNAAHQTPLFRIWRPKVHCLGLGQARANRLDTRPGREPDALIVQNLQTELQLSC